MSGIYKTYDIRGVYPEELDEETFRKIGRAYADMLKEESKGDRDNVKDVKVVVGRDMRLSSPSLLESLIDGVTSQGVDVINIGLVSTPTFYFGTSYLEADGGLVVSASHNPKEYNGVKVVKDRAYPVSYETGIKEIERRVKEEEFSDAKNQGRVESYKGVLEREVEYQRGFTGRESIKPLKVVADTANSMGSLYLETLFKKIPCELVKMNFELDGSFPSHEADPYKEENTSELRERVVEEGADLGIATDGDGDRIFFVDEKGERVEPGVLRGLLAEIVLRENPGAKIGYDIRPGRITKDVILENGGRPFVTKVGHSLIKKRGVEEDFAFAGESSGHFFFKTDYGFFETPIIVVLKVLQEISKKNKPFSEVVEPLEKYSHSGEISLEVSDKKKSMEELARVYSDGEINRIDGVTVKYDDFWFNVRPSKTEPLLRLNLEAVSKEIMEERRDEVLKIIKEE